MPFYLLWDIIKGALLLGVALSFCIFILSLAVIGVLWLLDWREEWKIYAGLKRSLLRAAEKKPGDTGGVCART